MKISAGQKVGYYVSYLSMDSAPNFDWPLFNELHEIEVKESPEISVEAFLSLYEKVGKNYEWTDQFLKGKEEVGSFLEHDSVKVFQLYFDRSLAGFFVLDFRINKICDLSYFGLIPDYLGNGLGSYMIKYAILTAWNRDIKKMLVNTNTLDHERALTLYKKYGFQIIRVEKHTRILFNDREATEGIFLAK